MVKNASSFKVRMDVFKNDLVIQVVHDNLPDSGGCPE